MGPPLYVKRNKQLLGNLEGWNLRAGAWFKLLQKSMKLTNENINLWRGTWITKINSKLSTFSPVARILLLGKNVYLGVPQVSVLGPLIFRIELNQYVKYFQMIPHYFLFSVMTQSQNTLNKDLEYIQKYELSNRKYYLTKF